jgi:nucleotide-binding universal stress UspA family protein
VTGSDTTARSVFIWVREGTWRAAVDAALSLAPADASFTLLHVTDDEVPDAAHGAYLGLFGRAGHDPGTRLGELAISSAADLLEAAARRLGRRCERLSMHGNTERAVVTVSGHADLLIVARDGDQSRPGPHSLGRAGRFIVDHAACPVLVVWPGPRPRDTPGGPRKPGKPDRKHHDL